MCNNASVAKNVTNLTIIGENLETGIGFGGSTIINSSTVLFPYKQMLV
jgi:hypothetical protein